MKSDNADLSRLKKLLYNDYLHIPDGAFSILKEDLTTLLSSYFDIPNEVDLTVDLTENGDFEITLRARATAVKELKIL